MESLELFGIRIDKVDFNQAIEKIKEFLNSDGFKKIYTPNPEIIMGAKDSKELRQILNKGDLITADGIGIVYASRIMKQPLEERVTGFDMSMEILKIANERNLKLYLLGSKAQTVKNAKENISLDYTNIDIVGYHSGYFSGTHLLEEESDEERKIIEELKALKPDIIFVGMGFPLQERFIDKLSKELNCGLAIGNGGVIDILANEAERAPEIWQKLNLEWFYRLLKDPKRIKRQIIIPKFMLEVFLNRK